MFERKILKEKSEIESITQEILSFLQNEINRVKCLEIANSSTEVGELYKILFKDKYELTKIRNEISLVEQYGCGQDLYLISHSYEPNMQNHIA